MLSSIREMFSSSPSSQHPSSSEPEKTYEPIQTMRGHTSDVTGAVHLPDRRHIVTCSDDGSLRLWNLESGSQIGNDWRDEPENTEVKTRVNAISLSPNGKTIASVNGDGTVKMWDVETGKVIAIWTEHAGCLCWSPNGERMVSGGYGTAKVWHVESGKTALGPIETGQSVCAVAYSPDGTKIATGGYDEYAVKIWDSTTGELLRVSALVLRGHNHHGVSSLAWTSDGQKLISGHHFGTIRICDTSTWEEIAILEGHSGSVDIITLFRNDRLLASTSCYGTTLLWNLDTGIQVGPPLEGSKVDLHHEIFSSVQCAAFAADGTRLVTGCNSNACTWDIHAILRDAGHEDLLYVPNVSVKIHSSISLTTDLQSLGVCTHHFLTVLK
jgi:WD40 repeat protein